MPKTPVLKIAASGDTEETFPIVEQTQVDNLGSLTVAEAEAKVYVDGQFTYVKESCRVYCYHPSSTATANGSTVLDTAGAGKLEVATGDSEEYFDFFVGSTLDEPRIVITSDGVNITVACDKAGGGDISYRATGETVVLDCTPAATVTLTAGTDSAPQSNFVYIDHTTGLLVNNTTGFPLTPHTPIGEYYARTAVFHQTNGLLGKNHRNHVFTPGDNGHMGHINSARRKQPCIFENGLLLTESGSGTATVNFGLSSGQLYRMHLHDVSGIASPADFFISNDEVAVDKVEDNLNSILTYTDGSSNVNEYCVYIIFIAHLDATTGLFLLKPKAGYNTESEAYTDPDQTANFSIPSSYVGASIYVARVVARRTASATTIFEINTNIRGLLPSSVAGGGISGVPDHGGDHIGADPIPWTDSTFSVGKAADATAREAFDLANIPTATTRYLKPPNRDVDLGKVAYDETALATEETVIVAADEVGFKDTSVSLWKRISWTNVLASVKSYTDTLYVLLTGKTGGQTLSGGTASGEDLTLQSTTDATKGSVKLGTLAEFDEAAQNLKITRDVTVLGTVDDASLVLKSEENSLAGSKIILAFGQSSIYEVYGGAVEFEVSDSFSRGGLNFYTKNSSADAPNVLAMSLSMNGDMGIGTPAATEARVHAKGSTSDSSSFISKKEDSNGSLFKSSRNDGQEYHSGSRIEGSQDYTASATLTDGSPSVVVLKPAAAGVVITGVLTPSDDLYFDFINPTIYDVTFGRNSELIYGVASNITIAAGTKIRLHYIDAATGWW